MTFRIGQGYDIHRLVAGRKLMIGGVDVPYDLGEEAHSDGDVLLHAITDALLGAACIGDIGTHFPPADIKWKNADSRKLLETAALVVGKEGYEIVNLDSTVILEKPMLSPHIEVIRRSIASVLGIGIGSVSVKAKTNEGEDSAGAGRSVIALAVVLLSRN